MAYAKSVKASPLPAQFCLIVVWPYHVTPLFHVSFSQRFQISFGHCESDRLQTMYDHRSLLVLDRGIIQVVLGDSYVQELFDYDKKS